MNKIIISILVAVIFVLGINKLADIIFYVEKPDKSAFQVATVSSSSSSDEMKESSVEIKSGDIMALLATASVDEGSKIFKKCAACHSISKGGGNKIGPSLWGVVGRKVGSISDYKYSKSMAAYKKKWSFEEINGFLIKPKEWIKGTKMSFAGLKSDKDRAAVIVYMNKNSDNSLPLR